MNIKSNLKYLKMIDLWNENQIYIKGSNFNWINATFIIKFVFLEVLQALQMAQRIESNSQ